MAKLTLPLAELRSSIAQSKIEIIFSGGHGGYVTYDGKGGQMTKRGGPMDRLLALRNDDLFDVEQAFDIYYGSINFATGKLKGDVIKGNDTTIEFQFSANEAANAIEIRGGIESLAIPTNSVLFSGSVEPSTMYWVIEKKRSSLPYVAFHTKFEVNPTLLRFLGVKTSDLSTAVSTWVKDASWLSLDDLTKKGIRFETQQHIGSLRIW